MKTQYFLIDLKKSCRICLKTDKTMLPLNGKLKLPGVKEFCEVSKFITEVTNVTIKGLPDKICSKCLNLLGNAFKFKVHFDTTKSVLDKYIVNKSGEKIQEEIIAPNRINKATQTNNSNEDEDDYFTNGISFFKSILEEDEAEPQMNKIMHPCTICNKEFTSSNLRKHIRTHKDLKKYINIPLDKHISTQTIFYNSFGNGSPNFNLIHKCPYCKIEYNTEDFSNHIGIHSQEPIHKCKQCNRVFKKVYHLNYHIMKAHFKELPYKCKICGKGFISEDNYNCHLLIHNEDQELPHQCKHCLKRFCNPMHLYKHVKICKENLERESKCCSCLKTFKSKVELEEHFCNHTCKTCKATFENLNLLNLHKLEQHFTGKALCSVCGRSVNNFSEHMRLHSTAETFECNVCKKKFKLMHHLKRHLIIHSGEKRFGCSVCGKRFVDSYAAKIHERIHKGEKKYKCCICDKAFLEKAYLKRHMNVHAIV